MTTLRSYSNAVEDSFSNQVGTSAGNGLEESYQSMDLNFIARHFADRKITDASLAEKFKQYSISHYAEGLKKKWLKKFSVESFFPSDEKMSLPSFVDFLDDTEKGNGKYNCFRGKLVVQFKNFLVNEWIKKKTNELEELIIGEAVTTRRK